MENPIIPEAENTDGKTLEVPNLDEMHLQPASGSAEFLILSEKCTRLGSSLQFSAEECNDEGLIDMNTENLAVCNNINVEAVSVADAVEREILNVGEKEAVGVEENDVGCFGNEEVLLANEGIDRAAENPDGSVEAGLGDELNSCGGSLGDQVEVKETARDETKEDVLFGDNDVDTATKIEVSGDNMSIYVDFSGPLSEVGCGDIDNVDCSGLLVCEGESEGDGHEEEELISKFCVGDVVWIKTKSQSWWPAKIYDPQNASIYAVNNDQKNCLLVGYFGINYTVWCLPSKLKTFHDNFEQMAGKNKSRSFLKAVEKALDEFGRCLKLEMNCSCYKSQQLVDNAGVEGEDSRPDTEVGRYSESSVTHFTPAEFLEQIRNLAQAVSKIGLLELTVAKSRLAAFYCSVGHQQLHMNQLRESTGEESIDERVEAKNSNAWLSAEDKILDQKEDKDLAKTFGDDPDAVAENREGCFIDDKFANCGLATNFRKRKRKKYFEFVEGLDEGPIMISKVDEAGFVGSPTTGEMSSELRERKKSKYLCYPYVDLGDKGLRTETEDRKTRKMSGEAETMNTVSSQFVGFCPVSITCARRFQKKWFEKIICGNNISHNSELENAPVADLLSDLCLLAMDRQSLNETGNFDLIEWFFSRFRISVYHDESIYEMYCKNVVRSNVDAASGKDGQEESQTLPNVEAEQKMQKKKKPRNPPMTKTKHYSDLSESDTGIANDLVKDDQKMGPATPNGKNMPKISKKQQEASQAGTQTSKMSSILDLNGNGSTPSLISHVEVKPQPKKRRKKVRIQNGNGNNKESGTLSLVQVNGPSSISAIHESGTGWFTVSAIPESNTRGFTVSAIPESNTGGFTVSAPNPNENGVVAALFAKDSVATTPIIVEGKPGPRKRKRKEKSTSEQSVLAIGIPDLNGTSAEPGTSAKAGKKRRKKGEATVKRLQKKSATGLPNIKVSCNKRKTNRKALGTSLILTFAPGATMPSEELLNTTFCKFGSLKESETKISKELCTAQIVFLKRADAEEARKSLATSNPFGEALLNWRLQRHLAAAACQSTKGLKAPAKPSGPVPIPAEAPPIDFIRHNLEMMTAMLENSGDNLSPEIKVKLEREIKGLLKKVSSVPSGSSS